MSGRGRPPAAHSLALEDQILAILRDEAVPMSTIELAIRVGYRVADHQIIWRRLDRLAKRGKVGKTRVLGRKATYWSVRIADVPTGGRL